MRAMPEGETTKPPVLSEDYVPESANPAPSYLARDSAGRFVTAEQAEAEKKADENLARLMDQEEHPQPAEPPGAEQEREEQLAEEQSLDLDDEQPSRRGGEKKPKGVDSEAYEKALRGLRLDGFDQEDLDGLTPERIIALNEKRTALRSKVDREIQARSERIAELEAEVEAAPDDDDLESYLDEPDLEAGVKRFADEIGLGDEAGEALQGILGPVVSQTRALVEENEQLVSRLSVQQEVLEHLLIGGAKARLGALVPDITTDPTWGEVYDRACKLLRTGEYGIDDAFDDAADLVTGGKLRAARRSVTKRSHANRNNGQPDSHQRQTPAKPMTPEDRENAILNALFDGDVDRARQVGMRPTR